MDSSPGGAIGTLFDAMPGDYGPSFTSLFGKLAGALGGSDGSAAKKVLEIADTIIPFLTCMAGLPEPEAEGGTSWFETVQSINFDWRNCDNPDAMLHNPSLCFEFLPGRSFSTKPSKKEPAISPDLGPFACMEEFLSDAVGAGCDEADDPICVHIPLLVPAATGAPTTSKQHTMEGGAVAGNSQEWLVSFLNGFVANPLPLFEIRLALPGPSFKENFSLKIGFAGIDLFSM
eukprot:gene9325-8375_t